MLQLQGEDLTDPSLCLGCDENYPKTRVFRGTYISFGFSLGDTVSRNCPPPVSHSNTNFLSLPRCPFLVTDVKQTSQKTSGPLVSHNSSPHLHITPQPSHPRHTHWVVSNSGQFFLNTWLHAPHIPAGGFQSLMSCLPALPPLPPHPPYPTALASTVQVLALLAVRCGQAASFAFGMWTEGGQWWVWESCLSLPPGECRQSKVLGQKSPNFRSSQSSWHVSGLSQFLQVK